LQAGALAFFRVKLGGVNVVAPNRGGKFDSSRLQFPGVGNFVRLHGSNLAGFHRYHGRGIAVQESKFYFVSTTVAVNMHNSSHVPRFKPFGWNAVTNLVW
jgi:hypothetical protein